MISSTKKQVDIHHYTKLQIIHVLSGIIQSIISIFPRCVSNFTDLFIVLISTGLAERYKLLNKLVIKSKIWSNYDDYWYVLRVNYGILNNLVKETDKIISPLILISCAHNFIYICIELFIGLSLKNDVPLVTIYSFYAFAFVVIKTIGVMFAASRIHDNSKTILSTIYRCPSSKYTKETERLYNIVSNDNVVLTGMNFFFITRNFILTVAGTIVTYEIILLQLSTRTAAKY
ncbi:hypothetical protein HCN44_008861 [Aphidius gifuensis]|uniref:Gustatory receptor n=1 Tax=Aphidius gifuensis TaxID=684658 RepID=A0A834Y5U5_APHGI|nr:hypothetical protein HCN44_008861 [Aphidius gifuensis]